MLNTQIDLSPEEQRRQAAERRARLFPSNVKNVANEWENKKIERLQVEVAVLRGEVSRLNAELASRQAKIDTLVDSLSKPTDLRTIPDLVKADVRRQQYVVTARGILDLVAAYYLMSPEDISGHNRHKTFIEPRHVYCYLVRCYTLLSLPQIGEIIGGRDHTTILHAHKRIKARLAGGDESVCAAIKALTEIIEGD